MKNKTQQALEMIASGYTVELVMDILNLEPEELYDILLQTMEPVSEPVKVTQTLEEFRSYSIGTFLVNCN
mgnify:CR=1 FL=1